jgi:hypothetical protein
MSLKPCTDGMLKTFRFLRDAGGWWNATEVAQHLVRDAKHDRAAQTAARWLSALARHGYVARRLGDVSCRFGVTASCLAPAGESLVPSSRSPVREPDEALA